jgi:hypothetical protein
MFFAGSRYATAGTDIVAGPNGRGVAVTRIPLPIGNPLRGYLRRAQGQRLDLISYQFLSNPTTFWKLCNSNNAISPDALAARDLVGVPNA